MSKLAQNEPKIASYAGHFVARHMLGKMPQRPTRALCVASMRESVPTMDAKCLYLSELMGRGRAAHSHSSHAPELALCSLLHSLALARTERRQVHHGRPGRAPGLPHSFTSSLPSPEPTVPPRLSHLAAPLGFLASSALLSQLAAAGAPADESPAAMAGPPQAAIGRPMPFCGCVLAMTSPSTTTRRQCPTRARGHAAVGCTPAWVRAWPRMAALLPLATGAAPPRRNRPSPTASASLPGSLF
jgi:hypothetical protein